MNPVAQKFQKRILQVLLAVAMALLLWGLVRLQLDGIPHKVAMTEFASLETPSEVVAAAIRAEPVALLCAGIAVLVITPFVRLILLVIDFLVQRDGLYAAMSVVVGVIVVIAFALRLH